MTNPLIQKAVEIAGSQSALARLCGKRQGHVSYWLKCKAVSAEAAVLVDAATQGRVGKHELRADLFSAPSPGREDAP